MRSSWHPLLGVGYDNWIPYYRARYNPNAELPHNIFVEAAAEFGYLGLLCFLGLILASFVLTRRTRLENQRNQLPSSFINGAALGLDAALVGYLISGFFVTVLFYPYFWMNLTLVAALYSVTKSSKKAYPHNNPSRSHYGEPHRQDALANRVSSMELR